MAFGIRRRKNINIIRIAIKIVLGVVGLYAGGFMLHIMGTIMNGTCSPFYTGVKFIGWQISTTDICKDTGVASSNPGTINYYASTSTASLLQVIGLLAILGIVIFEFVDISF